VLPAALLEDWKAAIDAAGRALQAARSLRVFSQDEQRAWSHALEAERVWLRRLVH
jgi:hypothetical protein